MRLKAHISRQKIVGTLWKLAKERGASYIPTSANDTEYELPSIELLDPSAFRLEDPESGVPPPHDNMEVSDAEEE